MQKEIIAALIAASISGYSGVCAADLSPEMKAKIDQMVKAEVSLQATGAPPGGIPFDVRIRRLFQHMKSLNIFTAFMIQSKRQKFAQEARPYQVKVAQACCPLKPASFLEGTKWYFTGGKNGKNRKGRPKTLPFGNRK